jgi:hypothetical protein
MKIESVFDLKVGDRIGHGRNYGTVTNQTEHGPEIEWDHGLIDYQYTEEMHKVHPLYKIPRHLNRGDEEIRETTWNLCKLYDSQNKRRHKVLLTNFITSELERLFSEEIENLFRGEWQEEVGLFFEKYGYAA